MSLTMSKIEREAFLKEVHVAIISIPETDRGPLTVPVWYVYDTDGSFVDHVNDDTVTYQRIQTPHWENVLRRAIEEHQRETQSVFAEQMSNHAIRRRISARSDGLPG